MADDMTISRTEHSRTRIPVGHSFKGGRSKGSRSKGRTFSMDLLTSFGGDRKLIQVDRMGNGDADALMVDRHADPMGDDEARCKTRNRGSASFRRTPPLLASCLGPVGCSGHHDDHHSWKTKPLVPRLPSSIRLSAFHSGRPILIRSMRSGLRPVRSRAVCPPVWLRLAIYKILSFINQSDGRVRQVTNNHAITHVFR